MKRYLAFMGHQYYPCGGIKDFIGDYDSTGEAISAINLKIEGDRGWDTLEEEWETRWCHVWDSQERQETFSR